MMNVVRNSSKVFNLVQCCNVLRKVNQYNLKISFRDKNRLIYRYIHSQSTADKILKESEESRIEDEALNEEQLKTLLENCTYYNNIASEEIRQNNLNKLWKSVNKKENLSIEIYNIYLKMCTENDIKVDYKNFLSNITSQPNRETYNLLLECVCAKGDVVQAVEILESMKKQNIPADEKVFNALIMGHIIQGGLKAGQSVLSTMKTAHISVTSNTYWVMIKALARRNNKQEFLDCLSMIPYLPFHEKHFYEVLLNLGVHDNYFWLKDLLELIKKQEIPRNFYMQIQNLCIQLIHCKRPKAAINYYKNFIEPTNFEDYGKNLINEMVNCKIPLDIIIETAEDLIENNMNPRAFFNLAEIILLSDSIEDAYVIFNRLEYLRPHFFWPILIKYGNERNEIGVFEVLHKMNEFNVKPDYETIEQYVLNYCNMEDVEGLYQRLLQIDILKPKDLYAPIIHALLKNNNLGAANTFCLKYNYPLVAEQLLKPLSLAWQATGQSKEAAKILQKICETNITVRDWTGGFLMAALKLCTDSNHYKNYIKLAKEIQSKNLKITSLSSDHINHYLKYKSKNCDIKNKIENVIDELFDVGKKEATQILHPRDMCLDELECHLLELQNKNMETRGVIRKLIQMHTQRGNFTRIEELRELLKQQGYNESPGMKSLLLHTYSMKNKAEEAEAIYKELRNVYPSFNLDVFKVVDLATALVSNGNCERALEILTDESIGKTFRNLETFEKNCWRLLNSANTPEEAFMIFDTLIINNYCKASNVILGPLVRQHLKRGDLEQAVNVFCNCTEKYKCTPLQLELLCAIIDSQNGEFLNRVLEAAATIHGNIQTQMSLIAALAENQLVKPLTKFIIELPTIHKDNLEKRCERWVQEQKVEPLLTLLEATRRLPKENINLPFICISILKIYSSKNDCEKALAFWKELEEKEISVPKEFSKELLRLLKRCNYELPNSLVSSVIE